jgi:putative spermidine/putrescine transport system ATP-binding protein
MAEGADRFVSFEGVGKTYAGGVHAVRDLDLAVRRGEFVTFLGPSGSGKTTSLMMLAGFETPTAGEIRLDGRSLGDVPSYRRNIGMVFQNYALFPHMTVAENIAFPLTVRRRPRAETAEAVKRALDLVQLGGFAERRPAQLSGGQQQRVALARALVFDPPLVLMDEPLGALDRQLREHMQIEIKHIHARLGVTLVYVTHDQGEALTMSDRVAIFRDGRLQQVAPPDEVYERPATSFVAQFVGESNQFGGTILGAHGGTCTVELDGGWRVSATSGYPVKAGDRTTVSVRPERLRLGLGAVPEGGCATVVEEIIYHGDHLRARLRAATGQELTAKLLSGMAPEWLRPGADLHVSWSGEDARALDPLPGHDKPRSEIGRD